MNAETVHIEINGVRYALRFGYAALRQLGKVWGTGSLSETYLRLANLAKGISVPKGVDINDIDASQIVVKNVNLSFETIDILADMVFAAIVAHKGNDIKNLESDDIADVLLTDPIIMSSVLTAYTASLPQPEKKIPAPARKRPAKKSKKS